MAASRRAIHHTILVAERLRLPRFFIGFTLVSLGTDAPEIVNSVVSSYLGHGDINVGDSVGSVFTQGSLVLGLFPFLTGGSMVTERRELFLVPALAVLALLVGGFLLADGEFSRWDGAVLILAWIGSTGLLFFLGTRKQPQDIVTDSSHGVFFHLAAALIGFSIVGAAAAGLVYSVGTLAANLGIPEYILSFFGASIGTSLPELAVEFTALRKGEKDIAMGDVLGSCLVDASLSAGIGPLLFPTTVTAILATRGAMIAAVTMLVASALLSIRGKHDRWSGAVLIAGYFCAYFAFLGD